MHHLTHSLTKFALLSLSFLLLGTLPLHAKGHRNNLDGGLGLSSGRVEVQPDTRDFVFVGQQEEILDLQSSTTVFRQVEESYQSTCQRDVPYQEQVCHNETEYKEECTWTQPRESCQSVPRQVCNTQYEQQCNTRYEQVCHNVPRQICQSRPERVCQSVTRYRQECRQQPGPPVCQIINGRRVCRPSGGQQVCHQVPYQEQVCHVENRQICSTQYENVCRSEPRQFCQQVPRNVCHTSYEQQCTTIPGERICQQVPRTVPVCNMETRHRTESYSCTQTRMVERADPAQIHRSRVVFTFSEEFDAKKETRIIATLSGEELLLSAQTGPAVVLWAQKSYQTRNDGEQIIRVHIKIMKKNMIANPFLEELSGLSQVGRELQLTSGKIVNAANLSLRLRIVTEGQLVIDRPLLANEFDVRLLQGQERSLLAIKLSDLGLRLGPNKSHQVRVSLTPALAGEAINLPNVVWLKEIEQSF